MWRRGASESSKRFRATGYLNESMLRSVSELTEVWKLVFGVV